MNCIFLANLCNPKRTYLIILQVSMIRNTKVIMGAVLFSNKVFGATLSRYNGMGFVWNSTTFEQNSYS